MEEYSLSSISVWENEINLWLKTTKTSLFKKKPIIFSEISSTNTFLKEHLNLEHGSLVIAHQQTQGRGQKNRNWLSNPGGLYLSIKLDIKPYINFQPFWMTATVATGLCLALSDIGLHPTIKWPNDVQINNKKIAGILTETVISNDKIITIIGLGCNINNSLDEIEEKFPELKYQITSLKQELSDVRQNILAYLLERILLFIEKVLAENKDLEFSQIKSLWNQFSPIRGKKVKIEKLDSKEFITGIVSELTNSGSLLILKDDGKLEEFVSGNIKLFQ